MATIEKRTNGNGQITYRVKVRLRGRPVESATFERLTDAKKWAQDTESAIRNDRYFKTSEAKRHTFAELVERYKANVLNKKSDSDKFIKNQTHQLNWWKSKIGTYLLSDITPALISEYKDKLAQERSSGERAISGATVNRYLAALSHAFTIAVKEWGWVEDNPVMKISRLRESTGRVRFLSEDERNNLLEACKKSENPYLYLIVVLALSTGARQMEILSLRWKDIDLNRNVIILEKTKNRERRVLHLSGLAQKLIREHTKIRRLDTDLIFPGRDRKIPINIRAHWLEAIRTANIENFRYHDLRHSAASYLAMNGASLTEIAEILGHKTLQMVKRYSHLSESHTSKVVEAMNKRIFG